MRKRNRPRVVWFPPTNLNSIDPTTNISGIQAFRVDASPASGPSTGEIPLVIDGEGQDPLDPAATLSDINNSGYRLRRIVGKIFCLTDQPDDAAPIFIVCTAAIIIRRIDPTTGVSLALTNPNSAELVSTQHIENYPDPWIWRRTWLLSNNNSPTRTPTGTPEFGETNFSHGPAVADGPHVDQKTARVIGPEERLFLNVTCQPSSVLNAQDEIPISTLIITDLRILASMRTSVGNRRNASR